MIHSDSVSRAFERRIAFSRMRERMTSASVGLSLISIYFTKQLVMCAVEGYIPANLERRRGHR
jgi:hypothetical protein